MQELYRSTSRVVIDDVFGRQVSDRYQRGGLQLPARLDTYYRTLVWIVSGNYYDLEVTWYGSSTAGSQWTKPMARTVAAG